ncbi:hypothetical protein NMY22_g17674 [Coprinellus aureogranulatus]|nr:hypothetical protein NMY22_g17674 [Coprinellus aureogranulatus]
MRSWSKQATTLPSSSLTSLQSYDSTQGFAAILDRDTNVFYALTKGNLLMSLDMGLLKTANATALTWNEVQNPQWIPEGAEQTQQEGSGAGYAGVSYLQPQPQTYGSPAFPTQHGKTASFFRDDSVQHQFAYIPDDGSATYVVDVTVSLLFSLLSPLTSLSLFPSPSPPSLIYPHANHPLPPTLLCSLDPNDRTPDPNRLLSAYFHSTTTLNYIRGLLTSGFASLHHPRDWSLGHVRSEVLRCVFYFLPTPFIRRVEHTPSLLFVPLLFRWLLSPHPPFVPSTTRSPPIVLPPSTTRLPLVVLPSAFTQNRPSLPFVPP